MRRGPGLIGKAARTGEAPGVITPEDFEARKKQILDI